MKLPGFRKGKVPPQVVVQRLGREVVVDEAIRTSLGRWYVGALDAARVHPVGDPDISLAEGGPPPAGEPLEFSFEIGVRPKAKLGNYKGLEVPKREPAADEEADRRRARSSCASGCRASRPSRTPPRPATSS